MEMRALGQTGLQVSEVSLGCWTLGGLNWVDGTPNGWANVDEEEVTQAIKTALDAGVNHFDNADVYGNGRAERMLARCLERLGVSSNSVQIATKVGWFPGTAAHAFEPAHIRHQCEQSLINLKCDTIDLYYLHNANFGENDQYLEGAAETMHRLKEEGKIRAIGQSAYSVADFAKAIPIVKPAVLQSWGHALDDQFIRPDGGLQALMEEHDLMFVAFSPLAQGLLLDKFDPEKPPTFDEGDNRRGKEKFGRDYLHQLRPKLAKIKSRFGDSPDDLVGVALGYVLAHPRVSCVIPGFRNERQVRANVQATRTKLTQEDVDFIRDCLA